MTEFQNKLLEMLTYLTKVLEENGLRYYVSSGTMLGAVRHEGFIPWDDDIDIEMPRSDYNKAIELFSKPRDHYVIESPSSEAKDFLYCFAKFYDLNTTMTEKQKIKIKRGVFIDIFPLDGIGDSYEESLKNFKKIDKMCILRASKLCNYRKGRKWYKNLATMLGYLLPINVKKMSRKINALCQTRDFDENTYVGYLMGASRQKGIKCKN